MDYYTIVMLYILTCIWIDVYSINTDGTSSNYLDWTIPDTDDYLEDNSSDFGRFPVEQRLMYTLLRLYERSVRPVRNASDLVVVKMGMTLTHIFDLDEKNQILITNVWLDQEWDDMLLVWDPDEFEDLRLIRLPCHKIWLPDIVLYNNGANFEDPMPANVMVTHEGNVFWPVPTILQSACKVDVTYFPFDEQRCKLKFGSWTYDGFQVDMTNRTTEIDLSNYVENGEWELVNIDIQRNVIYYGCCIEPFPDVTFTIHIRRRLVYYLYNVICPCVMMSTLTLLEFRLPCESGEKITMGITVLLSFSVFLLRMGESLPETSEFIPLLSIYLSIIMAMTSISVVMTVLVLNLHHRGTNITPVPNWLRNFVSLNTTNCSKPDTITMDNDGGTPTSGTQLPLSMTIECLAEELSNELLLNDAEVTENLPSDLQSDRKLLISQKINRSNDQIISALKRIMDRYESEDSAVRLVQEWRLVAVAIDKILFWIFTTGTLISTFAILVATPVLKFLLT